ncbi:hypothetical protein AB9P05_07095 [Roseivirga sp. BDSF3-8]|uniref:hypothetical protein n=1 Tax=Roseivirga sp. BDSF3-8 TaxID=3241598 RepID=UPI00353202DC
MKYLTAKRLRIRSASITVAEVKKKNIALPHSLALSLVVQDNAFDRLPLSQ